MAICPGEASVMGGGGFLFHQVRAPATWPACTLCVAISLVDMHRLICTLYTSIVKIH